MADKKTTRLAKMNTQARRGTHIIIHSPYVSIQDLLNERGDEYPSVSELDSFDHSNRYHDKKEIKKYNRLFNLPSYLELVHPEGGDRTCHWNPQRLCVYRDALMAGLRFPFHEFIVRLFAAVHIHPCQVVPNGWRGIFCFMVLCIRKNIPLSVALFRKIFQFKNSSSQSPGWVYINQRSGSPHIFNGLSLPENNPKWRDEFMVLVWKNGDWGTLFRKSFNRVSDGSPDSIELSEEEKLAYLELIADGGSAHFRQLTEEFSLKAAGLSHVSDEGNSLTFCPYICSCFMLI